jgi:hypothetical protein
MSQDSSLNAVAIYRLKDVRRGFSWYSDWSQAERSVFDSKQEKDIFLLYTLFGSWAHTDSYAVSTGGGGGALSPGIK